MDILLDPGFDVDAAIASDAAEMSSWLDHDSDPELSEALMTLGRTVMALQAANRPKRRPECPENSPSQKISIRIPKWHLDDLRAEAVVKGIPYQTLIKQILLEHIAKR